MAEIVAPSQSVLANESGIDGTDDMTPVGHVAMTFRKIVWEGMTGRRRIALEESTRLKRQQVRRSTSNWEKMEGDVKNLEAKMATGFANQVTPRKKDCGGVEARMKAGSE